MVGERAAGDAGIEVEEVGLCFAAAAIAVTWSASIAMEGLAADLSTGVAGIRDGRSRSCSGRL